MKDIVLTAKRQKAEILWFAASFCGANLINFFSILYYSTAWKELYTQLLWVSIITIVLYAFSVGIRMCIYLIKKFLAHGNNGVSAIAKKGNR